MEELVKHQTVDRPLSIGEVDGNWIAIETAINTLEGSVPFYSIDDFEYEHSCTGEFNTTLSASFKVRLLLDHPAMPTLKAIAIVNNKVRKVVIVNSATFDGADFPLVADTVSANIAMPIILTADDYPASIQYIVYDDKWNTGEPYSFEIEENLCVEPEFTLKMINSAGGHVNFGMDGTYTVDWGDGSEPENKESEVAHHDYEGDGPYYITITGTPTSIYEIGESGGLLTHLKNLPVSVNYLELLLQETNVVIDISNLVGLQVLNYGNPGSSTFILPETASDLNSIGASGETLSTAQVNTFLALAAANSVNDGNISLQDQTPPAPPTGQGIVDKGILEGRGWTVTVDSGA